jgi:hypothetical protein
VERYDTVGTKNIEQSIPPSDWKKLKSLMINQDLIALIENQT